MKKLFAELSSSKYKKLPTLIIFLALGIAGLMMFLRNFIVTNTGLSEVEFTILFKTIFLFTLGCAGFIVMLRGELHQGFSTITGTPARIAGLFWWLYAWWVAFTN